MTGPSRRLRRGRSYRAAEVIDALYQGLLDRPAEPAGLAFQASRLEEGLPLAEIVYGIGHSREYFEKWLRGGDLPALTHQLWASADAHVGEPPIYLLHIMKTGGTALVDGLTAVADGRFCLHQVFLDHLVAMPEVVLERASLVAGHLGMEALDYLPPEVVTATVIRNPVERVLSHYAHVLRDPALSGETRGLDLEEFIHSPRWAPYISNFQARNLVQRIGLRSIWRERSAASLLGNVPPGWCPPEPELPIQAAFEFLAPDLGGQELESRALSGLEGIRHVGTSDSLQTLLLELTGYWGVTNPPDLPRSNVGANRLALAEVPETLAREISDANPVDWALYDQARSRTTVDRPLPSARPGSPAPLPEQKSTFLPPQPPVGEQATTKRDRRALVLAMLASGAVTTLDAFLVQGIALMSLVVIGPCIALLGGRWKQVALSGAFSLVAATALSIPDGVWWSSDQLAVLLVVVLVSLFATVAGFIAQSGRPPAWNLGAQHPGT